MLKKHLDFAKENNKKILILGLGKTGVAAKVFFEKLDYQVLCFDNKIDNKNCISDINEIPWNDVELVIQSPGFPINHAVCIEAKDKGKFTCSDIDILFHFAKGSKFIGVTGTNGKSTTTALIHHILSKVFPNVLVGGNIGEPVLDLPILNDGYYVLELSSYQLEISGVLPLDVSVWTNLTPDHLDRHLTMERYVMAKKRIFDDTKLAIIGIDDKYSFDVFNEIKSSNEIACVSSKALSCANCYVSETGGFKFADISFCDKSVNFGDHKSLLGLHNKINMSMAYLVCKWFGVSDEEIKEPMMSFKGLEHRIEIVAEFENILFVNDSKATNAESTIMALSCFNDKNIFLIAGGKAKSDGLSPAVKHMDYVNKVFLIGDASERFSKELGQKEHSFCYSLENAFENAVLEAENRLGEEVVLLLSPACASFDQFKNYEERGELFKNLVYNHIKRGRSAKSE